MSLHIVDDEQRRDRPQDPRALRVPAARGHLLRYRSSTMCTDIACVALPRIYPRGARGGLLYFHHGLLGPQTDFVSRAQILNPGLLTLATGHCFYVIIPGLFLIKAAPGRRTP